MSNETLEGRLLVEGPQGLATRLRQRIVQFTHFAALQVVVQIATAAAGFLVIRALSRQEYGAYTLAVTVAATLGLIADGGSSIAMSAIAVRVWSTPTELGALYKTVLQLRRQLYVVAALIGAPLLLLGLGRQGVSAGRSVLIAVLVGWAFHEQISATLRLFVLRLHLHIRRVQVLDLATAGIRLTAAATSFLVPKVEFLLFALIIAGRVQSMWAKSSAALHADPHASPSKEMRAEILRVIRSQLIPTTFHIVQGQATVWLMAVIGTNGSLADVGALSRLGFIFAFPGALVAAFVAPHVTRAGHPEQLLKIFAGSLSALVLGCAALVMVGIQFPEVYLLLLGDEYGVLRREVAWQLLALSSTSLAGWVWTLNVARGWTRQSWVTVPATLLAQACALRWLPVQTAIGALQFAFLSSLPMLALVVRLTIHGFRDSFAHRTPLVDEDGTSAAEPIGGDQVEGRGKV